LDDNERAILDRLFAADFPGRDALVDQASAALVRRIDDEGSLALETNPALNPAAVTRRVPVEGELTDTDGVTVHVLLHVVDGYLTELEVYRDDSAPLREPISAADLRVIVL
jgi:hypothetical protein